jgi:hypothetical protein
VERTRDDVIKRLDDLSGGWQGDSENPLNLLFSCARLGATDTTNENALEEFAGTAACPTVHVSRDLVFERKPGVRKDLWVEIPRIVDDDHDWRVSAELFRSVREDRRHVSDVRGYGAPASPMHSCTDLVITTIAELQKLVRVAMLLVIIDQPRIGRGSDDSIVWSGKR